MMQHTIFAIMAKKESFLGLAVIKRGKMKLKTAIILFLAPFHHC